MGQYLVGGFLYTQVFSHFRIISQGHNFFPVFFCYHYLADHSPFILHSGIWLLYRQEHKACLHADEDYKSLLDTVQVQIQWVMILFLSKQYDMSVMTSWLGNDLLVHMFSHLRIISQGHNFFPVFFCYQYLADHSPFILHSGIWWSSFSHQYLVFHEIVNMNLRCLLYWECELFLLCTTWV
jgi:hypothetical protein